MTLSTWRAGQLMGLDVRWLDASKDGEEIVEIYHRRSPQSGQWHLWKPADDAIFLRRSTSPEVIQAASVDAALAVVLDREAVPDEKL